MRILLTGILVAVAAGLVPASAGATAAPFDYPVAGGTVRVSSMPKQSEAVEEAVSSTLLYDETTIPLSKERCPTGRVVLSAEKKSTMDRRYKASGREPRRLEGLFLPGAERTHCRIWLNARALHRFDEAQICNLVLHELGHARGLDHTTSGLMMPILPEVPVEGCEWAWSELIDAPI